VLYLSLFVLTAWEHSAIVALPTQLIALLFLHLCSCDYCDTYLTHDSVRTSALMTCMPYIMRVTMTARAQHTAYSQVILMPIH